MSDLRTAAQQALEAWDTRAGIDIASRAFEALRAALAQQDEPVAWMEPPHGAIRANPNYKFTFPSQLLHWQIPLYLAPPRCPNCASLEAQNTELDRKLAELEQDETAQEPVAWLYEAGADRTLHWYKPPLYGTPLYTAPPQRKPLTDEEIRRIIACIDKFTPVREGMRQLARAIERAHGIGEQS